MTGFFRTEPLHKKLGFILLILFGVVGNALSISLFFGVEVIFGSIASLIAIAWLGPRLGMVVTVIAAGYTYFLWNHGYAAAVFIAEGACVAFLLPRVRGNVALASTIFWILLGIPLHAALYRYGLGMDGLGVELATVKQATSGIFNSIVASLILSYAPFFRSFGADRKAHIPVYQHIFNIFVGAALVPAAILLVLDARSALKNIEASAMSRIEVVSTGIAQATNGWLKQQKNAILSVAWQIEQSGSMDPKRLQPLVESVRPIWSDYFGSFVTDKNGVTIAFDPPKNAKGESTIGIDFSDRPYFRRVREGGTGVHVSDVFLARGGVFEPVFNVTAPIRLKGQFVGVASGSLNLRNVIRTLHKLVVDSVFQATLVDRHGNVVVSDNQAYQSLTPYDPKNLTETDDPNDAFYFHVPDHAESAPMARWDRSYLGMRVALDAESGWSLHIEQPMAPMRAALYNRYIRNIAYLLGLSLVILFGSMLIAQRIAAPLAKLSLETTNLSQRLEQEAKINWPSSSILELDKVTENFKLMVTEFQNRFFELKNSRNNLKLAKDEAETANQMKSSFLANMSHEIRTPLGIMLGYTDLLVDEKVGPEQKKEFAGILKRNASQLSLLIDDILDLSKVEAGHLALDFEEVSILQMMKDLVADFTPKAEANGIELVLRVSDDVPDQIISDPARLHQVMVNLIGNAIKFTQGGQIELNVTTDHKIIRLSVKDEGLGISADDQAKLFRPFSQGDESLTRKFGGTGLGLALSKRLGVLLGGGVHLVRSQLGVGSTFELWIPLRVNDGSKAAKAKATLQSTSQKSLSGLQILLVEDSVDNQVLIAHLLERAGATVKVANNGSEGMQMALASEYDFVLMDLQMPVMDGLSAARALRELGYNKPLIALTAHAMAEFRTKCLQAGFNDHVSKPIHFDELLRALSRGH